MARCVHCAAGAAQAAAPEVSPMFRKLLSLVPALLLTVALAGDALAGGRALSPQQKAAATKEYARRAKKQFGPGAKVKVKYAGPTGRDTTVSVLGVGGLTGQQPNSLLGLATGRVVVHQKPAIVKKRGKVDATIKARGGKIGPVFSVLGSN
jgi:hypothetical protein